jgi:hypothetical protein
VEQLAGREEDAERAFFFFGGDARGDELARLLVVAGRERVDEVLRAR